MISYKKLIKMARKWPRQAALKWKRISLPPSNECVRISSTTVADKGHFEFYTCDEKRFMCPMSYLNSNIFRELLAISEEEFGLPENGPIMLPCDSVFMEYLVSLMGRNLGRDLEDALLVSLATTCNNLSGRCSVAYCPNQGQLHNSLLLVSSTC